MVGMTRSKVIYIYIYIYTQYIVNVKENKSNWIHFWLFLYFENGEGFTSQPTGCQKSAIQSAQR